MQDDKKLYIVVTLEFEQGDHDVPVEMPEGLNKEEARVYALGATQGILGLLRVALGSEMLGAYTTDWDESNLPDTGTLGLSSK